MIATITPANDVCVYSLIWKKVQDLHHWYTQEYTDAIFILAAFMMSKGVNKSNITYFTKII